MLKCITYLQPYKHVGVAPDVVSRAYYSCLYETMSKHTYIHTNVYLR